MITTRPVKTRITYYVTIDFDEHEDSARAFRAVGELIGEMFGGKFVVRTGERHCYLGPASDEDEASEQAAPHSMCDV